MEETRCSELEDYLAGMQVGCGYACEAAHKLARWPTNPAALIGAAIGLSFACCFWQLFPAAGGRCPIRGASFPLSGLGCRKYGAPLIYMLLSKGAIALVLLNC